MLFFDEEVLQQVYQVITGAKEDLTIVTPYISLWEHLKTMLDEALHRSVRVYFVIRDWDGERGLRRRPIEDMKWLEKQGIRIIQVPDLHAKVYMNERTVLLSSMNMTESSTTNSHEFAIRLENEVEIKMVRNYVATLIKKYGPQDLDYSAERRASEKLSSLVKKLGVMQLKRSVKPSAPNRPVPTETGVCIRCGKGILLDPRHPLCSSCYSSWAKFKNEDYQEKHCHSCGKQERTSFRRPLCLGCFRKEN